MAESYWDLATFFYFQGVMDSAYENYYKAYKNYLSGGENFLAGRMLLSMGVMQSRVKDYIGSQNTTIKGLKLIQPFDEKSQIYNAYNNLAISFNGLEEYDEAVEYHKKAAAVARDLNDKTYIARTANNTGIVYREMQDYIKAIESFDEALEVDSLKVLRPKLYAMVLDNKAFSRFKMGDTTDFLKMSKKALEIRDSIGHKSGIIINKLHIGEYYLNGGDTSKAFDYVIDAKSSAEEINNFEYLLQSLKMVAEIQPQNAHEYLSTYIFLNDSLLKEERQIRNKFARIRYETDQYISETRNLNREKTWIILIFIISAIAFLLIYYLREQRIKNKELVFERDQQNANEKIYKLLLDQQEKLEEGRRQERVRISEELHDGVLGDLFGARISLGLLDFNARSSSKFYKLVEKLQKVEENIRSLSRELRSNLLNEDFNFIELIKDLINRIETNHRIEIDFYQDRNIDWEVVGDEVQINLYRIIQEAFQNIIRHSEATSAVLKIHQKEYEVIVVIGDNGTGIKKSIKEVSGIGLKNMQSRIKKMKGDLKFESGDIGTSIELKIPLNKN